MKIRLNEELEKKVVEITGVDYAGYLQLHDIENLIEDLIYEYHKKEEELEDLEQTIEDNYERISISRQVF